MKRGHIRKNWKRRYFTLHNLVLRYYTDLGGTLKGEFFLAGAVRELCQLFDRKKT